MRSGCQRLYFDSHCAQKFNEELVGKTVVQQSIIYGSSAVISASPALLNKGCVKDVAKEGKFLHHLVRRTKAVTWGQSHLTGRH